jgi:hypothetical protein
MTGKFLSFYHLLFKIKKLLEIRLENDEGPLFIKLPVHPSTIEELALIRFWLLKLSQTHFEEIYANRCIINPEFLSVLNPRTGPRKILFHANEVIVYDPEYAIPEDFAQFICARRITLSTSLIDESYQNNLFKFITGTGNSLEEVRIRSNGANKEEFCEFLVKVNFFKFIYIISKV